MIFFSSIALTLSAIAFASIRSAAGLPAALGALALLVGRLGMATGLVVGLVAAMAGASVLVLVLPPRVSRARPIARALALTGGALIVAQGLFQ